MKKLFPIILCCLTISVISCKKETAKTDTTIPSVPDSGMYISKQFNESQITVYRNLVYSTRPNDSGQFTSDSTKGTDTLLSTLTLRLDISVPPNATSTKKQPLIIYIHGGDFLAGDKEDMQSEALTYSTAGYVSATINYRLTPDNESSTSKRINAIIAATDDVMNAIRYLKVNANTYHIDTTRIATIGSSAGGGLSLINAIQYDELLLTVSDYPGISSKVNGAVSTGATLIEGGIDPTAFLVFDSFDTPVLLFHANPEDGYRHTTWDANVIPTQTLINNSGNECIISPQPNLTHTVNLSVGGDYWNVTKDFFWKKLKLYGL